MNFKEIINKFKKPRELFLEVLHRYPETFKWMNDEMYLKFVYRIAVGKKLNLDNPQTFNEKLQWLKLNDHKDIYTTMVDKFEAKNYVANIIGEEYIIPTLGVWDNFDDIDFDNLPNQFVLKCTHDSGGLVICEDKTKFDINKARKKIQRSLNRNFYWFGREWPYKNVKPRIIAEKFMSEYNEQFNEDALTYYKFFCFDGEPKILYISKDKGREPHTDFFDMDFNRLPIKMKDPNSTVDNLPKKPELFDEMKELSAKLSKGLKHIIIDFYQINGQLYIGEETFYHCSGFADVKPSEWNNQMGEWINFSGGEALKVLALAKKNNALVPMAKNTINSSLKDYKLYCFNGEAKLFLITQNRNTGNTTGDYFDFNGKHLDLCWGFPNAEVTPSIPSDIDKMKILAEKLSCGIPELRVDFYYINNKIYFGELTFYDGSGFELIKPQEYNTELGTFLKLF